MMHNDIKKARQGNRDSMISLYESNKKEVMLICQLLLLDENAACNTVSRVFKNMWELLTSGEIHSEEEFTQVILRKAINNCKSKILKKNPKAFRIPMNRNFIHNYDAEKMDFSGKNLCSIILYNLPFLHRFIYVLHAVCNYSESQIASLIHTNTETIRLALTAENKNVNRICNIVSGKIQRTLTFSTEEFHTKLQGKAYDISIPKTVETTVLIGIDAICVPIQKKRKKKKRKIVVFSTLILLFFCCIAGFTYLINNSNFLQKENSSNISSAAISGIFDFTTSYYADIEIQDYGTITVALDEQAAPATVSNFISLAESGFYNGLTFHRIIEGFMMQGGDPNGDGTGGSDTTIQGEFTANGFENNLSHIRGAISMARSSDYNSASSQFFIVQEDYTSLDGQYAVFGYVTDGMEIVDSICEAAEPVDDNGTIPSDQQPIITSITIRSE